MDLIYSFNNERFHLGRLCKLGHRWPGTNLSLRRNHKITPKCVGCTGAKKRDWLLSFVDYKKLGWPKGYKLGRLCHRGHTWNGYPITLRVDGRCKECDQTMQPIKNAKAQKRINSSLQRKEKAQEYKRQWYSNKKNDIEWVTQQRANWRLAKAEHRSRHGRPSRAKSGEFATSLEYREWLALRSAIRNAGRLPSVARLVWDAQKDYWRQSPEAYAQHKRDAQRRYEKWRYMTDYEYRIYHREKSKRRKVNARGQTAVAVSTRALITRFSQFDNCCAYCGDCGDMEIEHVVPISKGGAHDIGNIVPACTRCNSSKQAKDMESWYQDQAFFSEVRLQKIRRITQPPTAVQLALA